MIVYVAGPYTAPDAWTREANIRRAEAVSLEVLRIGHYPICPHTMSRHFFGAVPEAVAIAWGLDLVRVSEALVLVSGWQDSAGTRTEIELARTLGLPVYRDFVDLLGRRPW
jgi:hypothetical protein